ncbi:hypothetical protein [Manganibacter manganicus]|nr:hypothetical protein [Pseudaminobacter manganicus]
MRMTCLPALADQRHDLVGISDQWENIEVNAIKGERKMPRSKAEHIQGKKPSLASQYRAIGPACIAAALLHAPKKKKTTQKFITPRAA